MAVVGAVESVAGVIEALVERVVIGGDTSTYYRPLKIRGGSRGSSFGSYEPPFYQDAY